MIYYHNKVSNKLALLNSMSVQRKKNRISMLQRRLSVDKYYYHIAVVQTGNTSQAVQNTLKSTVDIVLVREKLH